MKAPKKPVVVGSRAGRTDTDCPKRAALVDELLSKHGYAEPDLERPDVHPDDVHWKKRRKPKPHKK